MLAYQPMSRCLARARGFAVCLCRLAGPPLALGALLVAGPGCGAPNPRVFESIEEARIPPHTPGETLTEPDKIRALITAVRGCKLDFVQDGQPRDAIAAAAHLERRLARSPTGIPTARQFIDRIGAGKLRSKTEDSITLTDGTVVPVRDWLVKHLADIEGVTMRSADNTANPAEPTPRAARMGEVGILDALALVERSELVFVAPGRRAPRRIGKAKRGRKKKNHGKSKHYTAREFSEMLRKKWELLGQDIHELDKFIDEIATDAFVSMTAYQVEHPDGRHEPFSTWLRAQLTQRQNALANSG